MAIFVVSLDQFWQMTLDDAVRSAARQVQIGKLGTGPDFAAAVCGEFGVVAKFCSSSSLQYYVQEDSYFGGIIPATLSSAGTLTAPSQSTTTFPAPVLTFSASGAPEFLLVQVAYLLPFRIPFSTSGGTSISGIATENGTPALLSTVATVMEP
jgi:hypothetical protein